MIQRLRDHKLLDDLFSAGGKRVYAILDGASVRHLPKRLIDHRPEHCCLFRGDLHPEVAETAPYLVTLERQTPLTEGLFGEGWGRHWGVLAVVPEEVDFRAVRKHFRRFLMVRSPESEPVYFRYYDPRVLRVYLPTCTAEEILFVFGPVERFVCEDGADAALLMSPSGDKLRVERVDFAEADGEGAPAEELQETRGESWPSRL